MPEVDVTKLPNLDDLNGPLANRVYTAVKSAILDLDFQPGASIRKTAICDHLGLSRSPVSEALAKLSGEGLVSIVPIRHPGVAFVDGGDPRRFLPARGA